MNRHLLSAADLSREEALRILDTAEHLDRALSGREVKKLPPLRGRTVVNLFYEDSTRTRTSFELAAKRLSADVVNFAAKGSSVSKGESLKDTALTLEAMGADAVVIRHSYSGAAHRLATWVLEYKHLLFFVFGQSKGPNRPRGIKFTAERILMLQFVKALTGRAR